MPSLVIRSRWLLFLLLLVLAVPPAVPQGPRVLRRSEVRDHLRDATSEILRTSRVDKDTELRVRRALEQGFRSHDADRSTDMGNAERTVAEALRAKRFGLASGSTGLKILEKPTAEYSLQRRARLSRDLVKSLTEVIRRRSIVAEIGPGNSQQLDHAQLGAYLRDTLKVPDHEQVKNSFDSTHIVNVFTLREDATLLRLYGGTSKPIGRYFFCCLWPSETSTEKTRWSDASGLATPPGNLLGDLAAVTVPAGTTVIVGTVADNFADQFGRSRAGGNTQIFVPNVSTSKFKNYRLKESNAAASDIVILSDDNKILRFRPAAED